MDKIYIYVSGYARQNNGEAGIATSYYNEPNGMPFYEEAQHIGVETQNSAVYQAIIQALHKAREWHFKNVVVFTDNRLIVGQLASNMSARAQNIIPLHDTVKTMMAEFEGCRFNYVQGNDNKHCRELARSAALASPEMVTAQALQFELQPGLTGLILAFDPKMMMIQFRYKKGIKVNAHKHIHEQASYLVKGTLKYVVADQDIVMKKGAALVVSSNAVHQLEALEDSIEIVTYSPMRADLLQLSSH